MRSRWIPSALPGLRSEGRWRRLMATLGAVAAAALAIGVILGADLTGSSKGAGGSGAKAGSGTAIVQRRDLVATDTESGTLSYSGTQTVYNRLSGTITWLPKIGNVIKPGQTLYKVDNAPVVLFKGSVPAYRDLSDGVSDGPDVKELEQNLVDLGFDPSHDITIDETFDSATTAAVERWQSSVGETQSGVVTFGQIAFLPGSQRITQVNTVLGSNGSSGSSGSGTGSGSSGGGSGSTASTTASTPRPEFVSLTTTPTTKRTPSTKASTASSKASTASRLGLWCGWLARRPVRNRPDGRAGPEGFEAPSIRNGSKHQACGQLVGDTGGDLGDIGGEVSEPELLWTPSAERIERATLTRYQQWLRQRHGLELDDYAALWQWSVDDLEGFWSSVAEFFDIRFEQAGDGVLGDRSMPGASWFPGARLSYAEHIFRGRDADAVAVRFASESRRLSSWSWGELRAHTAAIAAGLRACGVGPGDRVAAYMPNIPETVAAFLACASIGAVWSSAAPEFGARSVIDRFTQIEPKVLLAIDGYRYGGKDFDRRPMISQIAESIPSLQRVVSLGYLADSGWEEGFLPDGAPALEFEPLAFDHPLWVLYSSGTTGLPKPIVHGQGGILFEHLKKAHLHLDAQAGDRIFWFTTTGWMMWNFLVGMLLSDASIVLFDGNPGYPDLGTLWDLAADSGMTTFGTSAAFIASCMKAEVEPRSGRDLSALAAVGSTGSPLTPEGFRWVYDQLGGDTWLFSTSGGTDLCTAFVGGVPTLPVYLGELQARSLGASVEAWDPSGNPLVDEVGELVITEPMPSMPICFWGDEDGSRYRESYFEDYPGVWRHGDWIKITSRGTAIISGRSDSTINRGGVRMGTSEIYRAVMSLDDVVDALVVDVPRAGTDGWMPLFVVLREGASLDDELIAAIRKRIREDCSPRHVPDEVRQIADVPRTLSGKLLEVPVKRILTGTPPEQAASRESLANPEALDAFVELAGESPTTG